jgi:hypothetical protein
LGGGGRGGGGRGGSASVVHVPEGTRTHEPAPYGQTVIRSTKDYVVGRCRFTLSNPR